jgi:hypothetical protein
MSYIMSVYRKNGKAARAKQVWTRKRPLDID